MNAGTVLFVVSRGIRNSGSNTGAEATCLTKATRTLGDTPSSTILRVTLVGWRAGGHRSVSAELLSVRLTLVVHSRGALAFGLELWHA